MSDSDNFDSLRTVQWKDNKVIMIDQTKLPNKLEFVEYTTYQEIAHAIKTLIVRGAPAIGVSAAFGLALAALQSTAQTRDALLADLEAASTTLAATRPTAVNLVWGLKQIMDTAKAGVTVKDTIQKVIAKSVQMAEDDLAINRAMGRHGSILFNNNDTIMTHCNAGALATVGYGTALGVIRATRSSGKNVKVVATETRPVQQGSRLTAFELKHDGFDVSLIPDTAVGYSMANNLVNKVIVGADRIVKTGHVFNKIGTYQVATMAHAHNIPFYVAAPLSTIDLLTDAKDVIIEMRKGTEVTQIGTVRTAPDGVSVINPAFDMTPPELISGIITEKGVATAPYTVSIPKLFEAN